MSENIQQEGVVRFVKDGYAYLKTESASSCGKCASKDSCISASMNTQDDDYSIRIPNKLNLTEGDQVTLGLAADRFLLGTALMYLLPLVFLFVFAGMGKYLGGELYSAIIGLLGLFVGLLIVKKIVSNKKVACHFELDVKSNSIK